MSWSLDSGLMFVIFVVCALSCAVIVIIWGVQSLEKDAKKRAQKRAKEEREAHEAREGRLARLRHQKFIVVVRAKGGQNKTGFESVMMDALTHYWASIRHISQQAGDLLAKGDIEGGLAALSKTPFGFDRYILLGTYWDEPVRVWKLKTWLVRRVFDFRVICGEKDLEVIGANVVTSRKDIVTLALQAAELVGAGLVCAAEKAEDANSSTTAAS